ncbi:MAG: hypothetical protein PHR35_23185, partial [Kiritimatiellae bacterium]|nr:hypothetical protein [Kiritimatiellia bacterium]
VAYSDYSQFISAGALLAPGQGETVWLINDHPVENIAVSVALPDDASGRSWTVMRKDWEPELKTLAPLPAGREVAIVLPGLSLTTLTT